MAKIVCNNGNFPSYNCNEITRDVEMWLVENVGARWQDWDWVSFGYVEVYDESLAVLFKLKFGI